MEKTCENCRFFVVIPPALHSTQANLTQCHQRPPGSNNQAIDNWPGVSKNVWCGKWKKKKKKKS
jgi:hypothetical protein